jgi:hypothetical protein
LADDVTTCDGITARIWYGPDGRWDGRLDVTGPNGRTWNTGVGDWQIQLACEDIAGDGKREIAAASYSGGAHCCTTHQVFGTIWRRPLEQGDGEPAPYVKLNGKWLLPTPSTIIFGPCSACMPGVTVFASLEGDGFTLLPALHRSAFPGAAPPVLAMLGDALKVRWKTYPSEEQMVADVTADIRKDPYAASLWHRMTEMIYTGHAGAAWLLFDRAGVDTNWSGIGGSRKAALTQRREFVREVLGGQFTDSLLLMNGIELLPPDLVPKMVKAVSSALTDRGRPLADLLRAHGLGGNDRHWRFDIRPYRGKVRILLASCVDDKHGTWLVMDEQGRQIARRAEKACPIGFDHDDSAHPPSIKMLRRQG